MNLHPIRLLFREVNRPLSFFHFIIEFVNNDRDIEINYEEPRYKNVQNQHNSILSTVVSDHDLTRADDIRDKKHYIGPCIHFSQLVEYYQTLEYVIKVNKGNCPDSFHCWISDCLANIIKNRYLVLPDAVVLCQDWGVVIIAHSYTSRK